MAGAAQGIQKTFAYKKQTGKGNPASGNGGQLLRRETVTMQKARDTYSNNEIVSHQQYTGDQHGIARSSGTLSGVLSGGTYADHLDSVLRRNRTAVTNIAGLTLTLAASGPAAQNTYKVTRSAGSFLTDGIKFGMVVRLNGMNAANNNVNLLVVDATATIITVTVLNGKQLVPEAGVTGAGVAIPGKHTYVPTSGHTNDYYTMEEFFSDIGRSHLFTDVQIAGAEIAMPATGNVTYSETFMGLGNRVKSAAQVLTTPTPETTSSVVASVSGAAMVNGVRQASLTSVNLRIDGGISAGESLIGSNTISDTQKGRIKVTGTFTAIYEDDALGQPFDDGSIIELAFAVAADGTDNAAAIAFALPAAKIFSDDADDGEKQIVRTYNFTAQINAGGGDALESYRTIIQIHDTLS